MRIAWPPVTLAVVAFILVTLSGCGDGKGGTDNAFSRGMDALAKHDDDLAIRCFTDAIRLDPKSAEAFYNRGYAYMSEGELDKAIADYNDAIRLNPAFAGAYANRGMA